MRFPLESTAVQWAWDYQQALIPLRLDFRIEGAAGTAIGAPDIIGPSTRDIESDPARSRWFRLGLSVGAQF
jgi:hypothetical protein